MSKDLNIKIAINAIDKATAPIRKITEVSKPMLSALEKVNSKLINVGNNKKSIKTYQDLKARIAETTAAREKAVIRIKEMSDEMLDKNKVSKRMEQRYESAERNIKRMDKKLKELNRESAERISKLKAEGIDTKNLVREQSRLGDSYANLKGKLEKLGEAQARFESKNARYQQSLQRAANVSLVAGGLDRIGRKLTSTVAAPTRKAIDFESEIADVDKFVKNANLTELREQILELGKTTPLGAAGIARLVAAGGKINLPADEALEFAKITERLAVAYNIPVESAADLLPKIKAQMGLTVTQMAELGDAINYVGDNSESNAPNITNILKRVGGLGIKAGLASEQVAAFAGLVDSMAPSAEIASTGMKNLLTTLSQGESLSNEKIDVVQSLGFDAQELAQNMQRDAVGTIRSVLSAIAQEDAAYQVGIIESLFGRESISAATNLVGNLDKFDTVMGAVADKTIFLNSAQKEYNRTSETTRHKLQKLQARWDALLIRIGGKLIPVLKLLMDVIEPIIDVMGKLIKKYPGATTGITLFVGGLGALAIALAPLITAVASLGVASAWASKKVVGLTAANAASGIAGGVGGVGGGKGKWGQLSSPS